MIAHENDRDRGGQDLATSTLAEIYAQQGLLERARAIYQRIAQRAPDDPRIAERIETLTRSIQERKRAAISGSEAAAPPDPVATVAERPAVEELERVADRPEQETGTPDKESRDDVFEAWLASR